MVVSHTQAFSPNWLFKKPIRIKGRTKSMAGNPPDKQSFYKSLSVAVTHAIEDYRRNREYPTHHVIDTCYIYPSISGSSSGGAATSSEFYDSTPSTDRLGSVLFSRFSSISDKLPYKFVIHGLTAIELISLLYRKAESYLNYSEMPIKINNGHDLVYGDQIVGKIDDMFRGYALQGVLPGLDKFVSLLRTGRIIGVGDCFDVNQINLIRKSTSAERLRVENQMGRQREHQPVLNTSANIRFRVDAGVIVETSHLNGSKQLGLLTTYLDRQMLGDSENERSRNSGIIRSPLCSLVLMSALEDTLSDVHNQNKTVYDSEFRDETLARLDLLLERAYLIQERLQKSGGFASLPRPFKTDMREFEEQKLNKLFPDDGNKTSNEERIKESTIRDKYREASELISNAAQSIVEKHPELLSREVLVDYDIDNHPIIINLRKKLKLNL